MHEQSIVESLLTLALEKAEKAKPAKFFLSIWLLAITRVLWKTL